MTTMAGLTVLRKNIPTPMHSWSAPNRKFEMSGRADEMCHLGDRP